MTAARVAHEDHHFFLSTLLLALCCDFRGTEGPPLGAIGGGPPTAALRRIRVQTENERRDQDAEKKTRETRL